MSNKAIYQIASLVMALVMILGNSIHTHAARSIVQLGGPSVYWGAMVNGKVPSSTNLQGVFNTFETRSKKRMSIIHWGQPWRMQDGSWGEFQAGYFTNVRNHGSIPMINWASHRLGAGLNQPDFQLRDIYEGMYDGYVRRWAIDAKNWGYPFFLYFNPEMNGWWYPWAEGKTSSGASINGNSAGDYVKAWRHVHDIFAAVGATNVTWVWAPNHMSTSSQYPALSTLYPGDAYVDWTGLSVYNKYQTWAGLNPLLTGSEGMTWFRNSYKDVLTIAPNKPMMLAQWASIEAGDGGAQKAAWITDALTVQIPTHFPKIKAVIWFNWQETANETYPIESSQAATAAWAAGIGSAVYAANQFGSLNTSPIPPLAPDPPGNVAVHVGGSQQGNFNLRTRTSLRVGFSDLNNGPVKVVDGGGTPILASQRYIYTYNGVPVSYSEMMGLPANQLSKEYWFPYYNNVAMDSQLRVSNLGTQSTTITVYLGTQQIDSFTLGAGSAVRKNYDGRNSGPLKVTSSATNILSTIRVLFSGRSYSEMIGLPREQLTNSYLFPYYNNVAMDNQLRVSNLGNVPTTITVYLGNQQIDRYTLGAGSAIRKNYDGRNSGPLEVTSSATNILATIRVLYARMSYSEMMGLPANNVAREYWYPVYDNGALDSQLRVSNVGSGPTTITVYAGGVRIDSYSLGAGGAVRKNYSENTGPLHVVSDPEPILSTIRMLYVMSGYSSYYEMMGLPNTQLSTQYFFPWYNNTAIASELRLAAP